MATIFLKIDGVKGDVETEKFTGQIEIDDVSFGMSRVVKSPVNSDENRESGTPYVSGLIFTKKEDSASPTLYTHHCKSIAFDEATISFVRTASGGEAYRIIQLDDVIVSDFHQTAASGDDIPGETIVLNFARVHITDYTTLPDGTNGSSETAGYDLALGIPT